MAAQITHKKAIIFGSASDIALALAYELAQDGNSLILCSRNPETQNKIAADLKIRYDITVENVFFDALAYASHSNLKSLIQSTDVAVCAFGYLGDNEKAIGDFTETQKIIETNYTATVSVLNIVAQVYSEKKQGVIVGISSVAGDRGRASNYIYGSAKAAFTAYLSGLRNKMCHENVHVITVKPGFVKTKMTAHLSLPPKLTATPLQVAKAIVKAIHKEKNIIYVLPIWRFIMFIISNVPEFIFKRLKL